MLAEAVPLMVKFLNVIKQLSVLQMKSKLQFMEEN